MASVKEMKEDKMNKFVFDIIGSEEGMKKKINATFKSLKQKNGVSEKQIRKFVEIIFKHSFDPSGNQKLIESLEHFINELV